MKRSKRIEALDARPVNLDGYINEWPEMGFIAMKSPYDPTPSVRVEDGKIVELDGKSREDFDFIDQFIADYAINIDHPRKKSSRQSGAYHKSERRPGTDRRRCRRRCTERFF